MDGTSLHQAQEFCRLLDGVLTRIQADDQADEDVKLAAFDIQEDLRFFQEAVFWSELRRTGQIPESRTTDSLVVTAEAHDHNALHPNHGKLDKATDIKNGTSAPYRDMLGSAHYGGFVGAGVASLHHVQHALTSQIPENLPVHVFGELAAAASCGAILTLVTSAICSRLKTKRDFA